VVQPRLKQQAVPWGRKKPVLAFLGGSTTLSLEDGVDVTIHFQPLALSVAVAGKPAIVFNGGHMFTFEHRREKKVLVLALALDHVPPSSSASRISSLHENKHQDDGLANRLLVCQLALFPMKSPTTLQLCKA
jgi:hypothetical protein